LILSEREHATQQRRAVIASVIGTTIEWYDFFLYSLASGLVFARLFFPHDDPLSGTLNAFAIYAVGFLARPIGAALFGHWGDRVGRKSTLIVTLVTMGTATMLVAAVPTYESIGIWGAVLLSVLRFVQGIGVGGEWGGSVLMSMEWAASNRNRGFLASWPQFGAPAGLFISNLVVLALSSMSESSFLAWGWRIPFALSAVLVAIGLWVRITVGETPVFRAIQADNRIERTPIREVIRKQPKEIVLSALVRLVDQGPFYIFTAFVFAYGTSTLKMPRDLLLSAVLTAAAITLFLVPYFGHVSDRIGRRKMYAIGAVATGLYGLVYFRLLDSAAPSLVFLAIALSLVPYAMLYGPEAALIAESFTPRLRYSGASLGYQLASIIAGGPAPLIATALFAKFGSGDAIAAFIVVCAVISLGATAALRDYTNKDVSREYDRG